MTTQEYTDHAATGLVDINDRFATILAELDWLSAQSSHLASIGLRELHRTVRTCTLEGDEVQIELSATATASGVTVILEDSGPAFRGIVRRVSTEPARDGDHRLRIIDSDFDEVTYSRTLGRSRWILRRFAEPTALSARPPEAA
jgi:anti-sigma regulatory factor (Ser/Thr protein kinase)